VPWSAWGPTCVSFQRDFEPGGTGHSKHKNTRIGRNEKNPAAAPSQNPSRMRNHYFSKTQDTAELQNKYFRGKNVGVARTWLREDSIY